MSWINEFINDYRSISYAAKDIRKFGVLVGGILVIIALFIEDAWVTLVILGGLLFGFGIASPRTLTWPYRIWMLLATVLGFIMLRILLILVYTVVITTTGVLVQRFGKDPMTKQNRKSYWVVKHDESNPEHPY